MSGTRGDAAGATVPTAATTLRTSRLRRTRGDARDLPVWPLQIGLAGFPLWWMVGLVDIMWVTIAALMALLLGRRENVTAPRGFGLWLMFLVFVTFSAVGLHGGGEFIGWTYRYLQYVAAGVLIVYVVSARRSITSRAVTGGLTALWLTVVLGGYLGMVLTTTTFATPFSHVMPDVLMQNDLVRTMMIRPFAQFDPEGFFAGDPRPSAPFLFTNQWGNVFSLLLPFVLAYVSEVKGTRRYWVLLVCLPISAVPAAATQNRGMMIGLGLALCYVAVRFVLVGRFRTVVGLGAAAVFAAGVFLLSPASESLEDRVEESPTTENRSSIYRASVTAALVRPIFGYGSPLEPLTPSGPPVGTHGQVWHILVVNGVPAVCLFFLFLALAFVRSARRIDAVGLAAHVVVLITMVEMFYYGLVPHGLPIAALAVALALRRDRVASARPRGS